MQQILPPWAIQTHDRNCPKALRASDKVNLVYWHDATKAPMERAYLNGLQMSAWQERKGVDFSVQHNTYHQSMIVSGWHKTPTSSCAAGQRL